MLLRILPQKIEVSRAGACDAKFHRGLRRGFPRRMVCDYSDQLVHIAQRWTSARSDRGGKPVSPAVAALAGKLIHIGDNGANIDTQDPPSIV